ncbi:hypothetical protein Cni_G01114 [Canna indica]|uniref:Uncharacterized protein n=1 Tax=Canna indica TaxID=4628 RepID=A0AAQ3PY77_9LILI|nr:hypothetical protein Cni_G01114 [Canna indica]
MEIRGSQSPFDCLLLDLDDTLYSSTIGIGQACKKNIEEFLASKCGISSERASSLRAELFKSHGSSLAGLIARGYDLHPDEYHCYVHGRLPYELIKPDAELRELLLSIPQHKILFTNSDRQHARRTLQRLGIEEECFHSIICFETMNPHLFKDGRRANCSPPSSLAVETSEVILKPSAAAMEMAVRLAGFAPHRMVFVDDNERNIASGKAVGLRTALVGKLIKTNEADYLLDCITGLKEVVPEIWGQQKEGGGEHGIGVTMRSDLDSMRPTTPIGA